MSTQSNPLPKSMRIFYIIWSGQVISMIGSALTGFALGVWMYEVTGSATPFVLVALFGSLPPVLFGAVAGALVDRWNRRLVLIFSDVGAAVISLVIFILFATGTLQVWHLYLTVFLGAIFNTFQMPAYSASLPLLVPKEQLPRANGMVQTGQTFGGILAPIIAGSLFGIIGVEGIILIDFASFFFAVGALLFVQIPQPEPSQEAGQKKRTLWQDIQFGIQYLSTRHGLLGLALFIALLNLIINSVMALSVPMILAFTTASTMGVLQSLGSIGMLLGGVLISAWGGPKYKMGGVYLGALISGIGLVLSGLQPNAWLIAAGYFIFLFPIPTVNTMIRTIMQLKVPADTLGRVFSILVVLARTGVPLGLLISGPVADRIFTPALEEGGSWVPVLGPIFGVGPGRGIGVMFAIAGILIWAATLAMFTLPALRNVETELPDAMPTPAQPPEPAEDIHLEPSPAD